MDIACHPASNSAEEVTTPVTSWCSQAASSSHQESELFRFERVPDATFEQARTRFLEWDDNDASFTDFVIATHMTAMDVDHIATYDRHYQLFDLATIPHVEFE